WTADPKGDKSLEEDDNYGGKNSGVMVGIDARKLPPPKAGEVNKDGIVFNPADVRDADNAGDGRLRLRIRAQAGDVKSVLATCGEGKWPLHHLDTQGGFDVFGGMIPINSKSNTTGYGFILEDDAA